MTASSWWGLLPSVLVLGLAALAALVFTRLRRSPPEAVAGRRAAARVLALTVVLQAVHFAEELATGFHDHLGPQFGLPGIPMSLFVGFNVAWLLVWVVSVPGLGRGWGAAFFAAWFLAVAGIANGIAHPLLALRAGGYFPGLISSPLIALAAAWLFLRLRAATVPVEGPRV